MAKGGKLRPALDRVQGRNFKLEKQRKSEKAAEKRKKAKQQAESDDEEVEEQPGHEVLDIEEEDHKASGGAEWETEDEDADEDEDDEGNRLQVRLNLHHLAGFRAISAYFNGTVRYVEDRGQRFRWLRRRC